MYYENQINNNLSNNLHGLTCYALLTEDEFANITMREKVIINSRKYIIKKISNYSPNEPTKIDLLSWDYGTSYDNRLVCNYSGDSILLYAGTDHVNMINKNGFDLINGISEYKVGIPTNFHYEDTEYKVKMNYTCDYGSARVKSIINNGTTGAETAINHNISSGTTGSFEVSYSRDAHNSSYPASVLFETLIFDTVSSNTRIKIDSIEVYQV